MALWRADALAALLCLIATASGRAATSESFSFTNLHRSIPNGSLSGLSDTRSVTSTVFSLTAVRVNLRIAGEFNGDLYGYVRQVRDGRTNLCVLLNRPGRSATNLAGYADAGFDIAFDDGATNGDLHLYRHKVQPAAGAPLTGSWQPDGRKVDPLAVLDTSPRTTTLAQFNGGVASGQWTLFLADVESGATNQLVSWGLEFEGRVPAPLAWSVPADIVYGTPLGGGQLNATSSVPGAYTYTPAAGALLDAGTGQTLSVTFTPADTNTYLAVATQVSLTVLKKDLQVTADDKSKTFGQDDPAFTASYDGFVNSEGPSVLGGALAFVRAFGEDAGSYSITPAGLTSGNYALHFSSGTLTVGKASAAATLVSGANPCLPGQQVVFTFTASAVAPGAGFPDGTVTFLIDGAEAGTAPLVAGVAQYTGASLALGTHTVRAEYAGSANFFGATNTLSPAQLVNTSPVAAADTLQRWPTNGTKVSVASLLANDSDADGDALSFVAVSPASANGGQLVLSNGWIFYTPQAGFTGDDSFSYTLSDGRGAPVTGAVLIVAVSDDTPAMNLAIASLGGDAYLIRGDGVPGVAYRIQFSDNGSDPSPVWVDLCSRTADVNGLFECTDISGSPARFYRAVHP